MEYKDKTVAYYTLGCRLNFAESSTLAFRLGQMGFHRAESGCKADLVVVNTCAVTEQATAKCRQQIRKLVRDNEGAFVVVTGCYAQIEPEAVANLEGVDIVVGTEYKGENITALLGDLTKKEKPEVYMTRFQEIHTFHGGCSADDRTRHFLKVQDGCDYFCTYCTIPMARGRSRNPHIAELVAMAEDVVKKGGKEIVLTGVNIGDFGKSTGESFFDLCKALDEVEGVERYRIGSIEPNLITDEMIGWIAGESKRFAPHFHIPLQAGSDEVLKLMRRRYDTALFRHKVELIKQAMPDAFIGVDVMVGCRGETPECFEECYEFLKSLPVTQLHVFPYSERPGTAALKIPYVVSDKDKKLRSKRLLELSDEKTQAFYAQYIGTEAEVLFEKAPRGKAMHGFTKNYVRVELSPALAKEEYDNQLIKVKLGDFNHDKTALKAALI